jgi:hypothetical protein
VSQGNFVEGSAVFLMKQDFKLKGLTIYGSRTLNIPVCSSKGLVNEILYIPSESASVIVLWD